MKSHETANVQVYYFHVSEQKALTNSTEKAYHHYGGRCAVRTCHIIMISADVSHLQCGRGYAVRRKVCGTGLPKLLMG